MRATASAVMFRVPRGRTSSARGWSFAESVASAGSSVVVSFARSTSCTTAARRSSSACITLSSHAATSWVGAGGSAAESARAISVAEANRASGFGSSARIVTALTSGETEGSISDGGSTIPIRILLTTIASFVPA